MGICVAFVFASHARAQATPPIQERVAAIGATPLKASLTADFSPGSSFTLEIWIYPTAPIYDWIAGKAYAAPGVDPHLSFALLLPSTRMPEFNVGVAPGVGGSASAASPIPLRTWTHLAGVSDGTTLRLYVNGVLSGSGPAPGAPAAPLGVPFSVGHGILSDGSANFYPFSGYARQLRLWSVARTAEQISSSLSETLPATPAGLVGAWPLDDAKGTTTVRDASGAGSTLTSPGLLTLNLGLLSAGPYYAVRTDPVPSTPFGPNQGVLLDFDGDGDLDMVVAQLDYSQASGGIPQRIRAFRNNTTAFTEVTDAVLGNVTMIHPRHKVVADFNGDGRTDVLFVGHGYDFTPFPGEQSRLLIQTADGRLVEDPARLPSGIRFTHNVAAGDIDGDGDLDIFMCNVASGPLAPQLFLNDGHGFFSEQSWRLPREVLDGIPDPPIGSHFVDVNRDGYPDLVLGPLGVGQNRLLMNDGTGRFTLDPHFTLPPKLIGLQAYTVNIESADFNGDGWPDLVLSTDDWLNVSPNGVRPSAGIQLLINRGDGTFTDATTSSGIVLTPRETWTEWIHPVDFSGDGRPDLVLDIQGTAGRSRRLLLNLGTTPVTFHEFTDIADIYSLNIPGEILLPGDIDRDGRIDFLSLGAQLTFARSLELIDHSLFPAIVMSSPGITSPTSSLSVPAGSDATFSVNVSSALLTYQWYKDGAPIDSATAAAYALAGVHPGDAGSYTVVASNAGGIFSSSPAVLTVLTTFESWRQQAFTNMELNDLAQSGPNAVYGHDGLPNLIKYALGLGPKTDATSFLPAVSFTGSDWIYIYARPTDRTDLTYTVEVCFDLINWSTDDVIHEFVVAANGTDTWRAQFPAAGHSNVFFRLKVSN